MTSFTVPTNEEKRKVWEAYHAKRPIRVPLRWSVNSRIILLNPDLNPDGYRYEEYFHDPRVTLTVQSRFQEYVPMEFGKTCDNVRELPEKWSFHVECQNTYDAAYFGAEVVCKPGQVPATEAFLTIDDVDDFLERDFSKPLENPWIKDRLAFREALIREAETFEHLGRKGAVQPFGLGFDGPLTVGANLFGSDVFLLLRMDPDKARRLLMKIADACLIRNRALGDLASPDGWKKGDSGGLADDSIQLIGTALYKELILPIHEYWYSETSSTTPADDKRGIHLCGDATRHFKTIREKLGVVSFDTGFPVDHGWLRKELGEDVEISGGPRVTILKDGSPEDCARATREILASGIMQGGRFILQEANNLPPGVPMENLEAVYETCLEYGRYE